MRPSLIMAAVCVICSSQAALASPLIIKLSRPNTSYATFLDDRSACLKSASHTGYGLFPGTVAGVSYDVRAFAACMNAKGYLLDPNGYRAIRYGKDQNGREWAWPI